MGESSAHGQDPSIIFSSPSEHRVCRTLSSLTMGRTGLLILARACHFESMRTVVLWDGISERDERDRELILPYFLCVYHFPVFYRTYFVAYVSPG